MNRSLSRVVATTAAALSIVGLTATSSMATIRYWNSGSQPLTVTGYGSTGWGYGSWTVSTGTDGTRSRMHAWIKLHNADNHKVFAKLVTDINAGYCLQPEYTSCNMKYYYYDSANTGHYSGSTYDDFTTTTGLGSGGDYARAEAYVQLDIPWRDDPSSGATYTAGLPY